MLIMDAIEMPLPTSAINPKVVLPNLSGRPVGPSEIRVSDGADASISARNRDSASTSSRTDTKFPPPPLPNHQKKPDFQIPSKSGTPIPASSLPRRIHTNSSEQTSGMILSLPKQDPSKTLNPKRSVKLINILPPPNSSNKRPKVEQGIEDSEESARNLKRGRSEGKRERGERRAVRGGNVRAKCEIGVSNDSGLGGSSILGMYGLKIDAHDITKNTEDPPLKNLLEGSRTFYRHSSSSRDNKGKKSICSKEELMHSIRKAHSLLPVRAQTNKKSNVSNTNKECDGGSKVKFCDKLALLCKNSSEMNPKEVLDRLSLNQDQDQNLNSILISTNPSPSLPALNAMSLPAFHWSTPPQSGAHKPSFDSVRLPWVRIGGNFTSRTEESDGKKSASGLLDYLEEWEKEDEKLNGLNCEKKEDASRRGEMSHETASVSGQTIEASKQGIDYSSRVVQAAEILFEISRISNFQTIISQKQTNGAIKWPNSPSLKTMKPSKPLPPFNKHENNTINNTNTNTNNKSSNVSNPFLSRNLDHSSPSRSVSSHSHHSSSKQLHKLPPTIDRKKHDNNNHSNNNNSSKGSIKWPIPTFSTDPKQQSLKAGNDKRPHNSNNNYSSQARLERDYENQQRIRKATLTASLTGNPSHGNSNPGNSNPGNSNPGNSGPWDWKRNKRG